MPLLGDLSLEEQGVEERLRTLSLCTLALCAVGYALHWLRSVLVPLVLAIALRYALQPLIDILTMRPLHCCGLQFCRTRPTLPSCVRPALRPFVEAILEARLPYWLGVCVALGLAFATLGLLGFVVADSMHVFASHADIYSARSQALALSALKPSRRWAGTF